MTLSEVKAAAAAVGFDDCGASPADALTEEEFGLSAWLAAGYQADMHYMERNQAMRHDPRLLVPGAQTVISVVARLEVDIEEETCNGEEATILQPEIPLARRYKIARFALGEDYHERLKRMLYQMIALLREQYPDFEAKPCVDSVPISDKLWAVRAGLGWIGRNTLFIHPRLGSFCSLGELVTPTRVEGMMEPHGTKMPMDCGNCRRCVDACPNHALGMGLDARRCASYHTVENRDERIPSDIKLSGYAFGCDCCQLVCPYNAEKGRIGEEVNLSGITRQLNCATAQSWRKFTRHTALSRITFAQWQRNMEHGPRSKDVPCATGDD